MKTYYIKLNNTVAVQAESVEQARESALDTFIEIIQRDTDVSLLFDREDEK